MKVAIISCGHEVVSGHIVNTNAAFLSKAMSEHGYTISHHLSIKDADPHFPHFLDEVFALSDLAIMTGGLGPTCDDQTRESLASYFDSPMAFNEEVADDLRKRFGTLPVSIDDQATIPTKAKVLLNPVGTAPGLVFQRAGKTFIALPGVPSEMKALFEEKVLPFLKKYHLVEKRLHVERVQFCLLFEGLLDPLLREIQQRYSDLEIGIYPAYGSVEVILKAQSASALQEAKKILCDPFGSYQYFAESGKISEALHHLLLEKKKTLCLAESCTGGWMAKEITQWPSASSYFLGSCVVYSNELKHTLLNVKEKTLDTYGAVSKEVVIELVEGLFKNTSCDFAAAVSGIAGPLGGSEEKPIGTVWCAIGKRNEKIHALKLIPLKGTREVIITRSSNTVLAHLYRFIKEGIIPQNCY